MAIPSIGIPQKAARAFTLIELLVTMVIISIVAGLALTGLGSSKQRSKIDKTKSTIRKLHEIVMPQYESYLSRRVAGGTPTDRLAAIRLLMVQEMPDQWEDVYPSGGILLPPNATAPPRRYASIKSALSATINPQYGSAECLAIVVTRGGFAPDAAELFRTDEMGDLDGDGAPEFWDGWGRPIGFIRWPAGYRSELQLQDAAVNPDPFDPYRVSTLANYPLGTNQRDYGLIPLIYSSGPGGAADDPGSTPSGYEADLSLHWLQSTPILSTRLGTPVAGGISDAAVESDNITNHDLLKR